MIIHSASTACITAALLIGIQCVSVSTTDRGAVVGDSNNVGNQKQLFIDDLFFESAENVTLRVQAATKTGERVLESDKPWGNATLNWFSIMNDNDKYRMWYECYDV